MAISDFLGGMGGAVSDLFTSMGQSAEAKGYSSAANIANKNAQLEKESTQIKQAQAQRQGYMVNSAAKADIGSSGLAQSGSALNILRSNAQQTALTSGVLGVQGQINEQGYQQQAAAYQSEASAAKSSAKGSMMGSIMGAVGMVAMLL